MDALDVSRGVPLACQDVGLRDAVLRGLDGRHKGAEAVDLNGVALREEFDDAATHLLQHAFDDVFAVDAVVICHVFDQTCQGDGLTLLGLGIVLTVAGIVLVVVLSEVDSELGIFDAHKLISFSRYAL